jgi:phage-related protein
MAIHHIRVVLMDEALAFVRSLPLKVQEKITYNYQKIEKGVMDKELFKKLENSNIWEFRTLYNGNCYRLFSFWDTETETLIIATHGIVKKTQKTPVKEIAKAEEIRREYFEQKNK